MKKELVFIIMLFFVAFFLRTFMLDDFPTGFHRDEAYFGYNAYSIFRTGRDMNGAFLPLHLKAFLYSPAGYAYLTVPSISLFGLNEFAVRLPSAFFGSLTVVVLFYFLKMLFHPEKRLTGLPHIAALLFTVSPWHLNLSRTATENTVVLFFITTGTLLLFFWGKYKKSIYFLSGSFLSFGVTVYLYQAPRVFLPFFIPFLFLYILLSVQKRHISKKQLMLSGILFFSVILLPVFIVLRSEELSTRFKSLSILNHPETKLLVAEEIREDGVRETPVLLTRVFHNKPFDLSILFLQNYFKHFSYDFLFTDSGLPDRYRIPRMGLLYLFELPLIILGTYVFAAKYRKIGLFFLGWAILAPIGSALTFDDVPNLQRTLIILPPLTVLSAAGAAELYRYFDIKKRLKPLIGILLLIILYNMAFYFHQYYIHQPVHRTWHRQDGYKTLVSSVNALLPDYDYAVISNRESDPAIFFLFYSAYSPPVFQAQTKGNFGEKGGMANFADYRFTQDECPLRVADVLNPSTGQPEHNLTGKSDVLYVNSGLCKPEDERITVRKTVKRGDGSVAFYIVERK